MATREVILRPGDTLAIVLDVPGRPMRLELALTEEGVAVGAPTQRPGPAPKIEIEDVESLPAMEPYGDEGDQILEEPEEEVHEEEHSDINLDLSDLDDEQVEHGTSLDQPLAAEGYASEVAEVEDDSGIPSDEMLMLPPTGEYQAVEDAPIGATMLDLDASGNPKERFTPSPDDTLPVWKEKASNYHDRNEGKAKKGTSSGSKTGSAGAKAKPPAAGFTVFLSPPRGDAKKQAAARLIAELQGIDMGSALALAGKMIVPVAKDVSEADANSIRDRFKAAGLNCRITQKR